ncbi:MAG: hypothetical protein Q4Q07_08805 [Tissierellia bacterium]|nr:hypothetical protein [Tissierellia bacterium]
MDDVIEKFKREYDDVKTELMKYKIENNINNTINIGKTKMGRLKEWLEKSRENYVKYVEENREYCLKMMNGIKDMIEKIENGEEELDLKEMDEYKNMDKKIKEKMSGVKLKFIKNKLALELLNNNKNDIKKEENLKEINELISNLRSNKLMKFENKLFKKYFNVYGLKNELSNCFFNAVMQCMMSLGDLIMYFRMNDFDEEREPVSFMFKRFLMKYYDSEENKMSEMNRDILLLFESRFHFFSGANRYNRLNYLKNFIGALIEENKYLERFFFNDIEIARRCVNCGNMISQEYVKRYETEYIELREENDFSVVETLLKEYVYDKERVSKDLKYCYKCKKENKYKIYRKRNMNTKYVIFYIHGNNWMRLSKFTYMPQKFNINRNEYRLVSCVYHKIKDNSTTHVYAYRLRHNLFYEIDDRESIKVPKSISKKHNIMVYEKK